MIGKALPAILAACGLLAVPVAAQVAGSDPHAGHMPPGPPPAAAAPERIELAIPDVSVLDEEGKPRRFYSDLVKGRVVAVNFLFTNCTTICPPLGVTFAKLRQLLGERAGRDFHLISVSVDPKNDTPARLKAWAAKFGYGPGWHLVTGERDEITRLLKALGAYTANPNDHPPLVLVGNDARQTWTRAYGLSPPAKLADLLEQMAQAPEAAAQPGARP